MFNNKDKCYCGGKRHNFEPRYSEKPALDIKFKYNCTAKEARSFMFYKIYEHDICIWCGKTVKI